MAERAAPIAPEALADARTAAPPEETLAVVGGTFRALADPTRVRILHALGKRPMGVWHLALLAEVSESAVSHQLRRLRERRLVKPGRKGNVIYYALDDHHLAALFREAERHATESIAVPADGRGTT